jgi:hypothetical protein
LKSHRPAANAVDVEAADLPVVDPPNPLVDVYPRTRQFRPGPSSQLDPPLGNTADTFKRDWKRGTLAALPLERAKTPASLPCRGLGERGDVVAVDPSLVGMAAADETTTDIARNEPAHLDSDGLSEVRFK